MTYLRPGDTATYTSPWIPDHPTQRVRVDRTNPNGTYAIVFLHNLIRLSNVPATALTKDNQ